jgi:hypothetical protein
MKRFLSVLNNCLSLLGIVTWVDCSSSPAAKNAEPLPCSVTNRAGLSEHASRLLPKATPAPDLAIFAGSEPGSQIVCPLSTAGAAHKLATTKRVLGILRVTLAIGLLSPNPEPILLLPCMQLLQLQ